MALKICFTRLTKLRALGLARGSKPSSHRFTQLYEQILGTGPGANLQASRSRNVWTDKAKGSKPSSHRFTRLTKLRALIQAHIGMRCALPQIHQG